MKEVINAQGEKEQVDINTPVKTIDGVHYLLKGSEVAELTAKTAEWQAGSTKRDATMNILRLEAQTTNRRLREAILGTDNGWLANQDALIVIERDKLK